MNCDQFLNRLHQVIDQRDDVSQDAELGSHAAQCDSCGEQLSLWTQIDAAISDEVIAIAGAEPAAMHRERRAKASAAPWSKSISAAALAASLLVLFFGIRFQMNDSSVEPISEVAKSDASESSETDSSYSGQLASSDAAFLNSPLPGMSDSDPEASTRWATSPWWNVVQDERWVLTTMPAMNSVGQSVAPIGRSMKQAIAILMSQPTEMDLGPSPSNTPELESRLDQSGQNAPFKEQTFLRKGLKYQGSLV